MYVVSNQISFLLFSHKTLLFRWFFCDKYTVPILYMHISTGYILKVDVCFSIYIETFPVLWNNIEYSIRMNVTVFFLLGILCSIEGEYNIYSWSNSHDLPSWITIVLRNLNIFRMTECRAKCKIYNLNVMATLFCFVIHQKRYTCLNSTLLSLVTLKRLQETRQHKNPNILDFRR